MDSYSFWPHSGQNFAPAALGAPQPGQKPPSGFLLPQLEQNLASAALAALQLAHVQPAAASGFFAPHLEQNLASAPFCAPQMVQAQLPATAAAAGAC